MGTDGFEIVLNNHFAVKRCTAKEGRYTPSSFHCRPGLRQWCRFFYMDQGIVDFISHTGKRLRAEKGDILFVPYDLEYSSYWRESRNGHFYTVEFILEDMDGGILNLEDDLALLFRDEGDFRRLFQEMAETAALGTLGTHLRCQAQFMHLLYRIAMHGREIDRAFEDIRPAILRIETDFHAETDAEELAALCHMSCATLRRRFLKYVGLPPLKYRNTLRIKKARELICTGVYTIGEAAEMVGLPDPAYFCRLYKQQFGCPPSSDLPKTKKGTLGKAPTDLL